VGFLPLCLPALPLVWCVGDVFGFLGVVAAGGVGGGGTKNFYSTDPGKPVMEGCKAPTRFKALGRVTRNLGETRDNMNNRDTQRRRRTQLTSKSKAS